MSTFIVPASELSIIDNDIKKARSKGADVNFDIDFMGVYEYDSLQLPYGKVLQVVPITINGEYKVFNWIFVATLDHNSANKLKVFNTRLERSIPDRLKDSGKECDHCHLVKDNSETYIIFNDDSLEWKNISKTCLKDFTYGMEPEICSLLADLVTRLAKLSHDIDTKSLDFSRLDLSKLSLLTSMKAIKKKAYVYVKENGYVSGETPQKFLQALNSGRIDGEASSEELREVDEWMFNHRRDSNYMIRAYEAWHEYHFNDKLAALITSALGSFFRDQRRRNEREQVRQNNLNDPANTYAGNVGDRVTFTIAEDPVYLYSTQGRNFDGSVYKLVDEQGHVYTWIIYSDDVEFNKGDTITGTIKGLRERSNGERQTEIYRCTVTRNQRPPQNNGRRGFFDPYNPDDEE